MSEAARQLLSAFEALSPSDRRQVALEILRRSTSLEPVPAQGIDELADELFQAYDAEQIEGGII